MLKGSLRIGRWRATAEGSLRKSEQFLATASMAAIKREHPVCCDWQTASEANGTRHAGCREQVVPAHAPLNASSALFQGRPRHDRDHG